MSDLYYRRPAFRPGVRVGIEPAEHGGRAVFGYGGLSFDVEFSGNARSAMETLCRDLRDGIEVAELEPRFADFAVHAADLLRAFDRYGLITETALAPPPAIPGHLFWQEVDAFAERMRRRFRPVLYEAMTDGKIGRGGLVRYAVEYYHVVRAGPGIIASALAHAHGPRTRRLLERFLETELRHDLMLAKSLSAAGLDAQTVERMLPLPETFAVTSAMSVLAAQEPLGFKAAAFLLEEANPDFHEAFAAACRRQGLGEGFTGPILRHAGINDEGDHGTISRDLLAEVDAVSPEERLCVLKQVATVIEGMAAMEHAILKHPLEPRP